MGVVMLTSNGPSLGPSSPGFHHRILIRGVRQRPASVAPRVGYVRCRTRAEAAEGAKAALDVEAH